MSSEYRQLGTRAREGVGDNACAPRSRRRSGAGQKTKQRQSLCGSRDGQSGVFPLVTTRGAFWDRGLPLRLSSFLGGPSLTILFPPSTFSCLSFTYSSLSLFDTLTRRRVRVRLEP